MQGKITYILLILFFCTVLQAQTVIYNQEFQVNTYTSSEQYRPSVCGLSDGGFVVIWQSNGQDGSWSGIFGQMYDNNGKKRGEEFQVNTYTASAQNRPCINGLSDGGFVVCWENWEEEGNESNISGQLFDGSGTKRGEEFQVNTYTSEFQMNPSVIGLTDGGFVVCWHSEDYVGDKNGIFGQMYEKNGTKRGEEFQENTSGYDYQICDLSDGGFIICWSYKSDIVGQMYDNNGIRRGEEFQVNSYTPDSQYNPEVCSLSDSSFVVCWQSLDQDGSGSGIFGQMYESNGTKRGQEFKINTYTNSYQWYPTVCGLTGGGFTVCWESEGQDGSRSGIFGQMYDGNDIKSGQEFQINTYTNSNQWNPKACGLSDGNFMVCWVSDYQDGSAFGIYGKYYLGSPIIHLLQSFSLVSPVFDTILNSTTVNFQWQKASPIHINFFWELGYTIYLDTSEEFNDPVIFSDIYDTMFSVKELIPGQTYFWKVLAKNIEGDSLWSSDTFGFYVSPAAAIEDDLILKPETFNLFQNYPNPFNPSTVISYHLPMTSEVKLSIYNYLGQKVVTLVSGNQNAGYHQVQWDASGFASGIYFYRIEVGRFKATQKMLLVR